MVSVICGIFTARWVLMSLGQVDYGLYGLVGSLVIFISFLNIQFSGAIARYYAYSVGRAKAKAKGSAEYEIEECRLWFSTAVFIHTLLPVVLICAGYPIGAYAISHQWLNIPVDRLSACVWLWRFVCISTFVAMVNVPFQAMYTAKQYIAELTIYSLAQTVIRFAFVYYMVTHAGEWLVWYGCAVMVVAVIPELVICLRACMIFPECKFRTKALSQMWRVKQLGHYAFWQGVGGSGYIASHQGMSIVINEFFGARITGSFSIANTVAGEAATLTGALQSAFTPAITTACGAGDMKQVREMAYRMSKIGTLITLLFALPIGIEIEKILDVWLKVPPPHAAYMCVCVLIFLIIEKLTLGHVLAVNATGRVAVFQAVRGVLRVFVIPLALLSVLLGMGLYALMICLPLSAILVDLGDVLLARKYVGLEIGCWLKGILFPLFVVSCVGVFVGFLPRAVMDEGVGRALIVGTLVFLTCLPVSWAIVLSAEERKFLTARLMGFRARFVN